jgi:hypothetical protein
MKRDGRRTPAFQGACSRVVGVGVVVRLLVGVLDAVALERDR